MSYTEIVKFNKKGNAKLFAEVKNAWRGAAAIWDIIGDRYLGKYIPNWAKSNPKEFDTYSRMHDNSEMRKVWALYNDDRVSFTDKVVLGSTFDWCVVFREHIPNLLKAFREFDGETSLKEQADIIEAAVNGDKTITAIAWNQTSVGENRWVEYKYDEKKEESIPYNIKKDTEHFSLFGELLNKEQNLEVSDTTTDDKK